MATLHRLIARDVWPHGFALRCAHCGQLRPYDTSDAAHFLKRGWPQCCGTTMLAENLLTQHEVAQKLRLTTKRVYQLVTQYGLRTWRRGTYTLLAEGELKALPTKGRWFNRKPQADSACPHCRAGSKPQMRRQRLRHCVDVEQDLWEKCQQPPDAGTAGRGG
jgi:hypothetical protein